MTKRFKNKLTKLKKAETLKKEKQAYRLKHPELVNPIWDEETINKIADDMLLWFSNKKNYWLKDFAIEHRIPSQYISKFEDTSEYFKNILNICKDMQESRLFHLGIQTRSSMPIFALKNVSKWRDKHEHEHTILDKETAKKEVEAMFE